MSSLPQSLKANPRLSRWIAIRPDGVIEIRTGKVELGQGIATAIAALAAAELGVAVSVLAVVSGDTRGAPDEGLTAGSLSIEHGGTAMRHAAAVARGLFAEAAAARLGVDVLDLRVRDGRFSVPGHNESCSYADLADAVDLDRDFAELAAPVFLGRATEQAFRSDLPAKLSGAAFVHDQALPDLHHGRVLRPAWPGARLVALDRAALDALPGVVASVVDGDFVGLIATSEGAADLALAAAARLARWEGPLLPERDAENRWMETAPTVSVTPVVADPPGAAIIVQRHEARYSRPYIAHASIGPSAALAVWEGGRLTVHSHTQGVFPLRWQLAAALDMPIDAIDVIHAMGAGCYGHNGADDVALDAALLARAAGKPVMCRWSRADEMSWSPFGAPMRIALSAGLDASGRIAEWSHDVWSPPHVARPLSNQGVNLLAAWHRANPKERAPDANLPGPAGSGDRNAVPLYQVGSRKVTHHFLPQGPLRSSALRSLGAHGNVFAIESFMDELAALVGADPVAFRLAHMEDARARAVIEAAARMAGWDAGDAGGEGIGRGIAIARYKNMGGYCALVARVDLTEGLRLTHVHAAVDCGRVVSRDGLINQIEGGIVQAASWTLKEAVRWEASGVTTRSWADYPVLKFSECPEISVEVIEPEGAPSLGAGECAAGPIAGAIGNAIAHALGVRVRHMPLTPERIETAIHTAST
jgi:nicotinate dehydrogenase subunit B